MQRFLCFITLSLTLITTSSLSSEITKNPSSVVEKKDGVRVERKYYDNGKLSLELTYLRDSLFLTKSYDEEGWLSAQNSWPDDKEQIQIRFRPDGTIKEIAVLDRKDGKNVGPMISFFSNGRINKFNEFTSQGRVRTYLLFNEAGKRELSISDNFSVWVDILASAVMVVLLGCIVFRRCHTSKETIEMARTCRSKIYVRILGVTLALAGIGGLLTTILAAIPYSLPNNIFSSSLLLLTSGVLLLFNRCGAVAKE
jgi:hypothetical protein